MMNTYKPVAALAIAALAIGTTATGASAEDTVATFELTGGLMTISVPAGDATTPLSLGSTSAGSASFVAQLGAVTVVDDRGSLLGWTTTATSTHFDLQGGDTTDPNQRVLNTVINYAATPDVTTGTGEAVTTPGTLGAAVLTTYVGTGNNEVTWDPTLTMTLLPTQVAGTYQGTVTHSVS